MNFIEQLKKFDVELFLYINGKHNAFFDFMMYWFSDRLIWIPFYLLLLILIAKNFTKKETLLMLVFVAVLITFSDQLSAHLLKNFFHRLRPCHNEQLKKLIHLVSDCGGQYGFVSSHATNSFALAIYLSFTARKKIAWLKFMLIPWAILVSYSRIYCGVHYPADIFCGALLGISLGYLFEEIYFYVEFA